MDILINFYKTVGFFTSGLFFFENSGKNSSWGLRNVGFSLKFWCSYVVRKKSHEMTSAHLLKKILKRLYFQHKYEKSIKTKKLPIHIILVQ
jgi:hypothetical protein